MSLTVLVSYHHREDYLVCTANRNWNINDLFYQHPQTIVHPYKTSKSSALFSFTDVSHVPQNQKPYCSQKWLFYFLSLVRVQTPIYRRMLGCTDMVCTNQCSLQCGVCVCVCVCVCARLCFQVDCFIICSIIFLEAVLHCTKHIYQ
jgi:hypothetical protein